MYRFLLLAGLIFFGSISCSQNKKLISVDPKYKEWIAGYTYGVISNQDNFVIELRNELDSSIIEEYGLKSGTDDKILKDILEISPAIKGELTWEDQRTIKFDPDEDLPSGQLYTVSLNLEKLAKVENGYEEFNFQFATIPQKIEVDEVNLFSYNSYNTDFYYAQGNITLTDHADIEKVKASISAEYMGKSVEIKLEDGYEANSFDFTIDSLERGLKTRYLKIKHDGKAINSNSKGTDEYEVAALGDFEITDASVDNSATQSIVLTFSETIQHEQNLVGLIDLEGIENETFSVYYNQVTVFLPHNIEGIHKLKVYSGIRNQKGIKSINSKTFSLTFTAPGPRLRLMNSGSILPDSKGLIFPFESIGLKSVTVRVVKVYEENVHHFLQVNNLDGSDAIFRFGKKVYEKNIVLNIPKKDKDSWTTNVFNLEQFIKPELGAIYRISLKFDQNDTYCDCPSQTENEENSNDEPIDEDWNEDTWHMDDWDDGYYDYDYDLGDESPCEDSYYDGKAISTNILASNLGIIFKMDASRTGHVFVTDMTTTAPMKNVHVAFYDFQKQTVASGTTDEQGMLETKFSRKPFLLVAKQGNQRGYLKVSNMHSKSLSEFDVEGEHNEKGLQGYIYGDRGVWRPGDTLFLNFILRDLEKSLPADHPVNFTLSNESNEVYKDTKTSGLNGHYAFTVPTSGDLPTGSYSAEVEVGGRYFTRAIRIESIKPNRLKINLQFPKNVKDSLASIQSKWLHGAPARNLRALVEVELQSQKTKITNFENYTFDSPLKLLSSSPTTLFDSKLSNEGNANFKGLIPNVSNAPGILKATYTTRVFENSGNFSIDRFSENYSPYKHYVGIRTPKKEADNSLLSGTKHTFPLVITDADGNTVLQQKKLNIRIYRMQWHWWYESNQDDFTDFIARNANMVVLDTSIITATGKSEFNFGIPMDQYGRFLITVTDDQGQHQTGEIVSFDQPFWGRGNQSNNSFASMLKFTTDKKTYEKGEEVNVSIPTAASGRALVSLETNKKIVRKFWIETTKGETNFTFTTTAEMTPNVYIHITLLQPHHSTINDLPIRMYGILPIFIDDPETHLHPIIKSDKEWKPETKESFTVSESSGKAMTYTVAIVDEGLLDLTRFKTPNPWNKFYSKEALGIETWDMYDDVIGAFGGPLNKMISIGGDGSVDDGAGAKANRFKPMVHCIGPFYLPAGGKQNHSINLPTYVGSVRIMVVAHNENCFGSSDATVEVKKPLMVLGTLPRIISPNETIELPVDVFAMKEHVKNVKVSVSANQLVSLGESSKQLQFKEVGDEIVNFKMNVGDKLGITKIKIVAESGNERAVQEFEVDVRSPNPVTSSTITKLLKPGQSAKLPLLFDGYLGTHQFSLEASNFKPFNFNARKNELIQYPHGCIEQTTSAVYPQLIALDLLNCTPEETRKMNKNIQAALSKYQGFQNFSGGFSYWSGQTEANEWGTNYAGQFMLEAEQKGFEIDENLKTNWLKYQKEQANNWETSKTTAYEYEKTTQELTQAYRLYTLAFAGSPELGAMNRMKERNQLSTVAKWRLAGAYFLAGQRETAKKMIANLGNKVDNYREANFTFGSTFRDKCMILEMQNLIEPKLNSSFRDEIASVLSSDSWLSTQETACGLIAMTSNSGKSGNSSLLINGENVSAGKLIISKNYGEELISKKWITVTNTSKSTVYLSFTSSKVPKAGKEKTMNSKLVMEINYSTINGNKLDPTEIAQGTDFYITASFKNNSKITMHQIAFSQLLPSGWEIMSTETLDDYNTSTAEYVDIRDDRVYSYFKLLPTKSKKIKLMVNASYLGKFYLPGQYAEAMYDHNIRAQKKGKWVNVVQGGEFLTNKVNKALKPKSTRNQKNNTI